MDEPCPIETTLTLVGNRWKLLVLRELFRRGTMRYTELRTRIRGISDAALSKQLKLMEADGLIVRRAYAEIPPRVEYTLTPAGRSLRGVMTAIYDWGERRLSGEH
jgi:DNA-binding HxlR family transcriptional regulator